MWGVPTEESDHDWWAVWSSPPSYYYGIDGLTSHAVRDYHQAKDEDGNDLVVWDIRRFMQSLKTGSCTTVELLFIPTADRRIMTRGGRVIHDNRRDLVTGKAVQSFWEAGCAVPDEALAYHLLEMSDCLALDGELSIPSLHVQSMLMGKCIGGSTLPESVANKRNNHFAMTPFWEDDDPRIFNGVCQRVVQEEWIR
jgi:hypothetical protein